MRVLTINEPTPDGGSSFPISPRGSETRCRHSRGGSSERANALIGLRNIRYVLARRDFTP